MERSDGFYPQYGFRGNYNCRIYAEIAIENYYHAIDAYTVIKEIRHYCGKTIDAGDRLIKQSTVSIVFSAATIEAFLNDYAAACIGDDDFYENFDRLSVISKLQMIAQFIMHTAIDKSQSCYGCLKRLENDRNKLIHSKSFDGAKHGYGYTESEIQEISESLSKMGDSVETIIDLDQYKDILASVRNGIKAIKELAMFMDKNDKNAFAIIRLFSPMSSQKLYEKNHPLVRVLHEFGVPLQHKIHEFLN